MPRQLMVGLPLVVGSLILAGCQDPGATSPVNRGVRAASVSSELRVSASRKPTFDELGDSVATVAPGFGGFYVDNQRRLVIWARDVSKGDDTRTAIRRFYTDPELGAMPVIVRQADFDVRDLRAWRHTLQERLSDGGWLTADIDERTNRVEFGVKDGASMRVVAVAVAAAGIPQEAVRISIIPVPRLTQGTPNNVFIHTGVRPIPGGVNISRFQYGFECTLGFIVKLDTSSSTTYGVTASHCTTTVWANDNTEWYQYGPLVFFENYEAPFTASLGHGPGLDPCPGDYACRYADAARLSFTPQAGVATAYGKIARTTDSTYGYSGGTASLNLDTSVSPYRSYSIGAETTMGSFYQGLLVHKMGRTTGHTYGPITQTCVNQFPVQKDGMGGELILTGNLYVCQMFANAFSAGGDSGAPVFINSNGFTILAGLNWGTTGDGIVFSPIDGVHWDLGPFATYPGGSVY